MKPEKLVLLIEKYRRKLRELGIKNIKHPHDGTPKTLEDALCHCSSMLDQLEKMVHAFVENGDRLEWDKIQRWLGFIQMCFWCARKYTIDDLKEHVRGCMREVKE